MGDTAAITVCFLNQAPQWITSHAGCEVLMKEWVGKEVIGKATQPLPLCSLGAERRYWGIVWRISYSLPWSWSTSHHELSLQTRHWENQVPGNWSWAWWHVYNPKGWRQPGIDCLKDPCSRPYSNTQWKWVAENGLSSYCVKAGLPFHLVGSSDLTHLASSSHPLLKTGSYYLAKAGL